MAPWDRSRRRNQARLKARIEALPTRLASSQPLAESPLVVLRGGVRQPWQDKARGYGRNLGVVRFSAGLTASTVSRCPMVAERLTDAVHDRWESDDDPTVNAVLRSYRNTRDTSAELVRRHAWHYQITGDLIQTVEQVGAGVEWFIYSTAAVDIRQNGPVLVRDVPGGIVANGGAREVPPEQVNRLWIADEDYPLLATSPMVAILDDCDRYVLLGRRTKHEAKSALLGNGVLYTPETAHKYPIGADGKPSLYSQLDQDFTAIASKAWDDDDSLASLAPFSVHYGIDNDTAIPPEWIDIGKSLDENMLAARREALECIVRGLPIPNVIGIEGAAGATANHWNGWLIEESFFKTSIAPVADTIFHSDLSTSMLRPSLRRLAATGQWDGNPDEWRVGYDPTPVIIHPDKAGRAVELYKLGAISRLSALAETGFGPEDVPSSAETEEFIRVQSALRGPRGTSPIDSASTVEGPPTPAALAAALAPYPSEVDGWLADTHA